MRTPSRRPPATRSIGGVTRWSDAGREPAIREVVVAVDQQHRTRPLLHQHARQSRVGVLDAFAASPPVDHDNPLPGVAALEECLELGRIRVGHVDDVDARVPEHERAVLPLGDAVAISKERRNR